MIFPIPSLEVSLNLDLKVDQYIKHRHVVEELEQSIRSSTMKLKISRRKKMK